MSLPAITIPVEVPFELPLLLHPAVAHFAIAIPIIVLILELSNLYFKRRALNVISLSFLILTAVVFFAMFLTGKTDGSEAFPLLSDAGQAEFKEHKLLGVYLVYASVTLFIFKSLAMLVMNKWVKIVYFLVLIVFISLSLKQGKDGGELVFEYGANVKAVQECEDKIEAFEDQIDELEEKSQQEMEAPKSAVVESKAMMNAEEETAPEPDEDETTEVSTPAEHSEPAASVAPAEHSEPAEYAEHPAAAGH
jgi:uncharacterized membrane protein